MSKPGHKHEHIASLLGTFPRKHVNAILRHFSESIAAFEISDSERCISKAGKFVEAVLKALAGHANLALPPPRQFKVSSLVIQLGQLAPAQFNDSIRLLIPRNCVFIYDIASNRGSRHDAADIDANRMDAIAVAQNIGWVLAEMIRLSHRGALQPDDAAKVVESLMEKRYPDIEEIEGRIYVNRDGQSARDVALLVLERRFPGRVSRNELRATLQRHGFSSNAAGVALTRIKTLVDDDGEGNLLLRGNGRKAAADIRGQSGLA